MITTRLNFLIQAYRHSKALIGDANRGQALPGPAFRMCHKIRRVVWREIERVARRVNQARARKQQQQEAPMPNQASDTGESAMHISRRADDRAMQDVISALQEGAHLKIHTKVRRAAIEGLPDKDARNGRTISASRCKRLAKEGVIREIGMDRYAMSPDFKLEA